MVLAKLQHPRLDGARLAKDSDGVHPFARCEVRSGIGQRLIRSHDVQHLLVAHGTEDRLEQVHRGGALRSRERPKAKPRTKHIQSSRPALVN